MPEVRDQGTTYVNCELNRLEFSRRTIDLRMYVIFYHNPLAINIMLFYVKLLFLTLIKFNIYFYQHMQNDNGITYYLEGGRNSIHFHSEKKIPIAYF